MIWMGPQNSGVDVTWIMNQCWSMPQVTMDCVLNVSYSTMWQWVPLNGTMGLNVTYSWSLLTVLYICYWPIIKLFFASTSLKIGKSDLIDEKIAWVSKNISDILKLTTSINALGQFGDGDCWKKLNCLLIVIFWNANYIICHLMKYLSILTRA